MVKVKEELEEAMFWHKERNGVRDLISGREEFIPKDKKDFSLTRENRSNKLYTLNFGRVVRLQVEKIEKSHLFHFKPDSNSLFCGLPGCNFKSPFCSEFETNNKVLHESPLNASYQYFTPDQMLDEVTKKKCKSITFNYTEPFMFLEFAFKVAKNAQRNNVKTTMVTNGYTTEEPIKKIGKFMDAVTFKITGSLNKDLYKQHMSVQDVDPIFSALKQMKKQRIFIEVTNLIVPKIGDSEEECKRLASWISHELGAETPFHLLQYYPNGSLDLPPTPVSVLEDLAGECEREGLRYVYVHSLPPSNKENTYCHNCRELVVERKNLSVKSNKTISERCPNCGFKLNFVSE